MLNETTTAAKQLIENSKNILIVFKKEYHPDSLASALALYLWLKKNNKTVTLVCSDFIIKNQLQFLPHTDQVKNKLSNSQKFIISLNLATNKVAELSYEVKDECLEISILPTAGQFDHQDIKTSTTAFSHDLIITLDTQNLDALGKIFINQTDFFYQTPLINFDHSPLNNNFGQVNVLDLCAVATAEIVYNFIQTTDPSGLDEDMATCLLAGIMTKTQIFKSINITPQSLSIASQLIGLGAQRQKIVTHLYQSQTLSTLRLWGRMLARLQQDKNLHLVWSTLSQQDFVKSGAEPKNIKQAVDELISSIPEAALILIIYEDINTDSAPGTISVTAELFASPGRNALSITHVFHPQGTAAAAHFILANITPLQAEKIIIDEIRRQTN